MATDQPDDQDRVAVESGRTFAIGTAHFVAGRAVAATARGKSVVAARITSESFTAAASASAGMGGHAGGQDPVEFAEPIHVEPMALVDAYPFVAYAGPWAQSLIQMEDCRSRGHQDCRGEASQDDGVPLDTDQDASCRSLALAGLLDEGTEWSALIRGLPPGDSAENALHESLMPRWDRELEGLWPAIAAVADLLLHDGEVDGNTVRQLVVPS